MPFLPWFLCKSLFISHDTGFFFFLRTFLISQSFLSSHFILPGIIFLLTLHCFFLIIIIFLNMVIATGSSCLREVPVGVSLGQFPYFRNFLSYDIKLHGCLLDWLIDFLSHCFFSSNRFLKTKNSLTRNIFFILYHQKIVSWKYGMYLWLSMPLSLSCCPWQIRSNNFPTQVYTHCFCFFLKRWTLCLENYV